MLAFNIKKSFVKDVASTKIDSNKFEFMSCI